MTKREFLDIVFALAPNEANRIMDAFDEYVESNEPHWIPVTERLPEIVRCKDCKYAEYIDDVQTLWCTECGQGRTVAPNDFCSYAER